MMGRGCYQYMLLLEVTGLFLSAEQLLFPSAVRRPIRQDSFTTSKNKYEEERRSRGRLLGYNCLKKETLGFQANGNFADLLVLDGGIRQLRWHARRRRGEEEKRSFNDQRRFRLSINCNIPPFFPFTKTTGLKVYFADWTRSMAIRQIFVTYHSRKKDVEAEATCPRSGGRQVRPSHSKEFSLL